MKTTTKSEDWTDELFHGEDEMQSGNEDTSWIFEFLGWKKYAKAGRRAKSNW